MSGSLKEVSVQNDLKAVGIVGIVSVVSVVGVYHKYSRID
jgi:hypothetical protein